MTGPVAIVAAPGLDLGGMAAAAGAVQGGGGVAAFVLEEAAAAAARAAGVHDVAVLDGGGTPLLGEEAAAVLADACLSRGVELIGLPATVYWREVAARLAVQLDGSCTTDVVALRRQEDGTLLADRHLYGGLVVGTFALQRRPVVVTLPAPVATSLAAAPLAPPAEEPAGDLPPKRLLERRPLEGAADLAAARRIVAVGRGLRAAEDLVLIDELAGALNAAVGCTRPLAEDLRWLTKDRQIGLTGQTVRPDLYVAVGLSGQIQHLVGMRDSGVVVAINTNPAAPIFEVADLGVVGDLYEIVPLLVAALASRSPDAVPAGA
jgi:electron transfer flavoprotein alpha subunit